MTSSDATGYLGRISGRLGMSVNNEDVLVRFVSLWLVVASIFTTAWIFSYVFLPEGLLRGGNPGAATGYAGSVLREFLWLFGWNVGVSLIAVAANTLRSVNTPLGYVIEVVQAPWYGAVWGLVHSPSAQGSGSRRRWRCS
jgi:hypothetical protein